MFQEFRRAWREAVANFWVELEADEGGSGSGAVYREVARARNQVDELDEALAETRQRLAEELEQVEACVRRERLARKIGDEETARLAAEYRDRHQERAEVLGRKLDALEAERRLCIRDLGEMERALQEGAAVGSRPELDDLRQHPREVEFRTLEESERGRSVEERLEELKRRMGR